MNTLNPIRSSACVMLASNIRESELMLEQIKGNALETNSTLAFCEIAMSVVDTLHKIHEAECGKN
jgi:hypothetical protein